MARSRWRKGSLAVCLALAGQVGVGLAQEGRGERAGPNAGMRSGLQSLKERFEAAAPDVGEMFPNVTVYNAEGCKAQFQDLVRDHYSVVVLGCLT